MSNRNIDKGIAYSCSPRPPGIPVNASWALNVPVSSVDAKVERVLFSTAIPNWCVMADSLSDESVTQLCAAAWNGDLYVDVRATTIFISSLQVCNVVSWIKCTIYNQGISCTWWWRVVVLITGILRNILTSGGTFCSIETGTPGGRSVLTFSGHPVDQGDKRQTDELTCCPRDSDQRQHCDYSDVSYTAVKHSQEVSVNGLCRNSRAERQNYNYVLRLCIMYRRSVWH